MTFKAPIFNTRQTHGSELSSPGDLGEGGRLGDSRKEVSPGQFFNQKAILMERPLKP